MIHWRSCRLYVKIVRELDAQVVVGRSRRLVDDFERSLGDHQTMALIVGCFSGIALLLAAVGLYGAMAYVVRQRTREVGLRLALGATPASILGLMIDRGARLLAVGVRTGLLGAFAGARFIQSRLFGIGPTDAVTWVMVVAVLVAVGIAACVIPAYDAMRTDPNDSLRDREIRQLARMAQHAVPTRTERGLPPSVRRPH